MTATRRMRLSLALVLAACMAGCGPSVDPEESLRAWLDDAEQAVEDQDREKLLSMISERYADGSGNDRAELDRRLRLYFLRNENIVIVSNLDTIAIIDDTVANVSLTAAMAGTDGGRFGFSSDAYRFDLELERVDDEWQLIGAQWTPVGRRAR